MKTLFFIGILTSIIYGQISIDVHIGNRKSATVREQVVVEPQEVIVEEPPQDYVEEYENREDLVVISPNLIGFWIQLPSGNFVLHCRSVWYNDQDGRMFYGPWREDRHYIHHQKYVRYDDNYRGQHYPKHRHCKSPKYIKHDNKNDQNINENRGHDNRDHGRNR